MSVAPYGRAPATALCAIVILAGCGSGDKKPDDLAVEPCGNADSTLPVLAIRDGDEEGSLRVVAPGEACSFAVDSYRGTLYVELRKRPDDPTDYATLRCYDLVPKHPVDEALKQTAISPGQSRKVDEDETESLLDSGECARPVQRGPAFILD